MRVSEIRFRYFPPHGQITIYGKTLNGKARMGHLTLKHPVGSKESNQELEAFLGYQPGIEATERFKLS